MPDTRCLSAALRLLSRRDHSCRELGEKLLKRGFEPDAIAIAIKECGRLNYLDEERFAKNTLNQLRRKGYGRFRIQQVFQQKGLPKQIIAETFKKHYSATDQIDDCRAAALKKVRVLPQDLQQESSRRGLFRFLMQRGFPVDLIHETLDFCAAFNDPEYP